MIITFKKRLTQTFWGTEYKEDGIIKVSGKKYKLWNSYNEDLVISGEGIPQTKLGDIHPFIEEYIPPVSKDWITQEEFDLFCMPLVGGGRAPMTVKGINDLLRDKYGEPSND